MIRTEGLTKTYGKARGVAGLTLRVPAGSCFGFIGPNGAGKSTTIRLLLGLLRPDAGSAQVLGLPCGSCQREILARVGYMPSEAAFWPDMRAEEVIRYSARLRGKDCARESRALCQALEVDGKKRVRELSLGNRKKLSIVCAMQHRPDLYILDEPTSGLDPLAQKTFWELLAQRRQAGAGIFLSSHVLSEVQRYCDRAAIIREGTLIREGTVAELTGGQVLHIVLRGADRAPDLPGVAGARRDGDSVSFLYRGEPGALLRSLSALPLTGVRITEPELEEMFLHYYEEGTT